MAEKNLIYTSKIRAKNVIYKYADYYKFCYDWLMTEVGLDTFSEKGYSEKISGDSKEIDIKWEGTKKLSDYFRMDVKLEFKILALTKVEVVKDGIKKKADQAASNELAVKGTLVSDYQGKFEKNAWTKFLRGLYERWIIPERLDQMETKVFKEMDEFLGQVKAYLALEGNTYS